MLVSRARATRLVLLACVLALPAVGCASASVRDAVASDYQFEREEKGPDGRSLVYRSPKPPTRTAAEISDRLSPGERRVTESGVFLRYASDYVGVVPDGRGGSRIFVDDERRGYGHFYPYVGGYWGSYSGRGESFRGGGPGTGK
jgi:hypothetical protein